MELVIGVVVSIAISWLLMQMQPRPKSSVNYRLPSSSYGQNIPEIINEWRLTTNWIEPREEKQAFKIREGTDGKGKSGAKNDKAIGTFLGILADGGESGYSLIQLYMNGNRRIDYLDPSPRAVTASNDYYQRLSFIPGLADQLPWTPLENFYGYTRAIAYRGKCLIGFADLDCTQYGNTFPTCSAVIRSNTQYSLGSSIKRICQKAGIPTSRIDTSELDDIAVRGFPIPGNSEEYLKPLETLMASYFFYPVDTKDGGISFRLLKRPGAKAFIPYQDIGVSELGEDTPINFSQEIEDNTEMPTQVVINYYNVNNSYEKDTVVSDSIGENTNVERLDFDLLLTEGEAKAIANRYLYQIRNSYRKFSFILPIKYLDVLEPGDVINLPNGEAIQISTIEIGANFILNCSGTFYRSNVLQITNTTDANNDIDNVDSQIEVRAESVADDAIDESLLDEFYILDIPLFNQNLAKGSAVFISALDCELYYSYDNIEFFQYGTVAQGTLGDCFTTLESQGLSKINLNSSNIPLVDSQNTLDITLNSEITSISDQLAQLGENTFFVGKLVNNQWQGEIIQALTVESIGESSYRLSELRRGLYGTENYIDMHSANEKIFLTLGNNSSYLEIDNLLFNQDYYYKTIVADYQRLDDVITKSFQYQGNSYKEYPVIDIELNRNTINNDLIISYTPREIPQLKNEKNLYQIRIFDGATLLRAIDTKDLEITYTANQQIADFGQTQTFIAGEIVRTNSVIVGEISKFALNATNFTGSPQVNKIEPSVIVIPQLVKAIGENLSIFVNASVDGKFVTDFTVINDKEVRFTVDDPLTQTDNIYFYEIEGSNIDLYTYVTEDKLTIIEPTSTGSGSGFTGFVYIAESRSLTDEDNGKILVVDTSANNITLTLDVATLTNTENYHVHISNDGSNSVIINTANNNNLLAKGNELKYIYDTASIYYDGNNNWRAIGALDTVDVNSLMRTQIYDPDGNGTIEANVDLSEYSTTQEIANTYIAKTDAIAASQVTGYTYSDINNANDYQLVADDYKKEFFIDSQTKTILLPNDATGFDEGWDCLLTLSGTGDITFKRANNSTTGIIFSGGNTNTQLKTQGTVSIRHLSNNVWFINGFLEEV